VFQGIEPEQHQVGEVIACERLVLQVRMHESQSAQARMAGARAADVRQHELPGISHDHVLDLTPPVDEHAQLSPDFPRQFS